MRSRLRVVIGIVTSIHTLRLAVAIRWSDSGDLD
jgi:hypothetical protein